MHLGTFFVLLSVFGFIALGFALHWALGAFLLLVVSGAVGCVMLLRSNLGKRYL